MPGFEAWRTGGAVPPRLHQILFRTAGGRRLVEVTIIGTNGEEYAYGSCPSAMTFFEQAEMVRGFVDLRFAGRARVTYRNLEDGQDAALAAEVRQGSRELPVVLIGGEVRFEGDIPWRDIQRELRQAVGA